jgi:hypothetical protein
MQLLFTQAQLLQLTGMTVERLRHWRKEMPDVGEHKGRSPTFTLEEVVALAVMHKMNEAFGVSAAQLAPHSSAIFAIFADDPSAIETGSALCLTKDRVTLVRLPFEPDCDVMLIVRTDLIAAELYARIVLPKSSPQLDLPLV